VQLSCLEGIQDFVMVIVQLASGNTKFSQGVGRVGEAGVGVQILEEVGKFGSVIKLPAGVQGGIFNNHLFLNYFFL